MKPQKDDAPMRSARALVEAHITDYGMVPHPDKMKEAIAKAIREASPNPSDWRKGEA